jgi:hypothetical protein
MTKSPLLVAGGFVLAIVTAAAATLYITRDERATAAVQRERCPV